MKLLRTDMELLVVKGQAEAPCSMAWGAAPRFSLVPVSAERVFDARPD
jgi:hypothetical protein